MSNFTVLQKRYISEACEGKFIWVGHLNQTKKYDNIPFYPHIGDYYLFSIIEHGICDLYVDFNKVTTEDGFMGYVLPGEVMHFTSIENIEGYVVCLDKVLIDDNIANILSDREYNLTKNQLQLKEGIEMCKLIYSRYQSTNCVNNDQVLLRMIDTLISIFAEIASCNNSENRTMTRSCILTNQFRKLVVDNAIDIKSPSVYASMMNISSIYLNEVVKKCTGMSSSEVIQEQIILVAKRMLYHSNKNIKEIAHELGYEDHTYFTRLFTKKCKVTPTKFRQMYVR